jgi:hypothetical protein
MPVFASESKTGFLKEINAIYSYFNPGALLKTLFSFERIRYLCFLFLPFGFLPLFSPFSLVALPGILINILSSNPAQLRVFNYYSAVIMAVFLAASLDVVSRKKWLSLYLLSVSLFTLIFFGPSPEYEADRHSRIGLEFLKNIPGDASVYSQVGLAGHLSRREKLNIYLVDYNYNRHKDFSLKDYEYAVLDLKGDKFPDTGIGGQYFARLKELINQEGMELVKKEDGFLLLKRRNSEPHRVQGLSLNNRMTWRGIFIEEGPCASPVLYTGKEIGLAGVNFPSSGKQGGLFWLELDMIKLKEFSGETGMQIEFRGRKQSFFITPLVAHGIFNPSLWKKGEILKHIETVRFSPFLWPGTYEIFFKIRDTSNSLKIGEVAVKRR